MDKEPSKEFKNPLNPTPVKFDNFMLDVDCDGHINKDILAEQFKLDVEYTDNSEGLFITQNGNIIKKPFNLSQSKRKINQEIKYIPEGFTKIIYAEKKNLVRFSRPPESIPIGCWCKECDKIGPNGHELNCRLPNFQSLNLTLRGFIDCLYSDDKTYRSKLRDITSASSKQLISNFLDQVNEIDEPDDSDYISVALNVNDSDNININNINTRPFLSKEPTIKDDLNEVFTNFSYETVRSITGLNKDGSIDYFAGAVIIQYFLNSKKSSTRVYDNGKISIISCPWEHSDIIYKVIERINDIFPNPIAPKLAMIPVATGSFRLVSENTDQGINLDTLYKCFHPTDKAGNPIEANDYMFTETFEAEDGTHKIKHFTQQGKNKFEYEIFKEDRGKLTLKFIKYDRFSQAENYRITTQIYNAGIVQFIYSIKDDNAKKIEKQNISLSYDEENIKSGIYTDIEPQITKQLKNVTLHFNLIRDFLTEKINKMFLSKLDIFKEKEISKISDKIFNVVPGVMPFRKKANMYAGYIVDFFDANKHFTDNYGWSTDDSERGYVVEVVKETPIIYKIIKGVPEQKEIVETKNIVKFTIKNEIKAPLVAIKDSENTEGYLLEDYKGPNKKHWVIIGKPENYSYNNLRIHKQSINDKILYEKKETQVCKKSEDGIDIRPDPYSFYGKCSGGLNQYIDRIGVRSRKDNKFYPICTNITNKDRSKVENGIIDFLLNGLTQEQLNDADINPDVEFMYGEPIQDKYAGTFEPGTIDIGNRITFWDLDNEEWIDGTLMTGSDGLAYRKSQLGNDLNYTSFSIIDDDGKEHNVRGEQFHPKHRENRNFEGLNNIFKNEKDRKEFLINCAKKLNLVKPEISIEKTDIIIQNKVIKVLNEIIGKNSFTDIVTAIDPFIEKSVDNFTKHAYEVAIIPENSIRSILFIINDNDQYLIDGGNKIMKVSLDMKNAHGTVIDGFITDQRVYYPIDLLYYQGKRVNEDYLNNTEGRLYKLQNIISESNNTNYPNSIKLKKPLGNTKMVISNEIIKPFIGPTNKNISILEFIKINRKENDDIIFIPQIGTSRMMIWKNTVPNKPIVVQLLKPADEKYHWVVGLYEKINGDVKAWRLLKDPINLSKIKDDNGDDVIFKTNDYIKLRLNMMANGTFNELNPYSNPIKVSKDEAKSFEETRIDLNLITRSVDKEVFNNTQKWIFPKSQKTLVPQQSSREPLKEKVLFSS